MKRRLLWLLLITLCFGISVSAQNYSATFDNTSPETSIKILKKVTGYNFVYRKNLLKDNKATVTGSYHDISLDQLLESTVAAQLGLAYKVVDKTVSLSIADRSSGIITGNVSGSVVDSEGEPLAGATIMLKGTRHGVSADIDGHFSIMVNQSNPELEVTYVGMHPRTIPITADDIRHPLTVKMTTNASTMEEVVVTGYQNLKRENATGSYQVLTADDLDKKSSADLASRLEGAVPGLVLNPKAGSADEDAFSIRGVGTFRAKASPLVVVDGLPIEGGLSSLNPYEINNITVLKDAAAASIYGARASNGVIVITTKQASDQRLTIDFNADLSVSERNDYSNYEWATAADMIELEKYNFNAMLQEPDLAGLNSVLSNYNDGYQMNSISKVMRLLLRNYKGELSDSELNSTLDRWSRNDYRKEYERVHDRTHVSQLYNLAMRVKSNYLSSSINLNYTTDNRGVQGENFNTLTFRYRGDLKAAKWIDLSFGVNVLNTRGKYHSLGEYGDMNSFQPYESMYEADGSLNRMEAGMALSNPYLTDPSYGLKDGSFNIVDEMNLASSKSRYTNTRTFINARVNILKGWTANAMFQYEDIFTTSDTYHHGESYYARNLYNLYTAVDGTHYIPDGGTLSMSSSEGQYYTFRAQTDYSNTFGKHFISALAGMEYRQTRTTRETNSLLGYDPISETNSNLGIDWSYIKNPESSLLGDEYFVYGAPSSFGKYKVLHRFYSLYANASYVFDSRYSVSGSYRVDKTDLFGVDPKFRSRPLWSVGASWNAHNEPFLRDITWLNALKLRASYGLTGNIDPNSSSYLTAKIAISNVTQNKTATLNRPPNDQLRWEKTATWNVGADFALLGNRLNGSVDYYRKKGSDLLTNTDLDISTGWSSLILNSGNMLNRGIEVQLNGVILPRHGRRSLGITLGVNFAYNHNEITKVSHFVKDGFSYMNPTLLHEGYPMDGLFSFNYAGIREINGSYYMAWLDRNGEEKTSSIGSKEFTIEDVLFSGSTTPKFTGSLQPTITWNGFSLSALMSYYGGHYMRVGNDEWTSGVGSESGYASNYAISKHALDYWHGDKSYPANGYFAKDYYEFDTYSRYRNNNVVHADYMKVRNLTLSYNFDKKLCNKIGINDIRLRVQMNNLATWARNSRNLDPEAVSAIDGYHTTRTPRSYTFSLFFNL